MKLQENIYNYYKFRALFLGIGISKILILSKSYYFISILIGTIVGYFVLKFIKIKNNKYLTIISNIFLFIITYIILINMISTIYLTNTPKLLIGTSIIILLIYISSKKEINIYRLSTILFGINIFLYLTALISLTPYYDLENYIYTKPNTLNILKGAIEYFILSVSPAIISNSNEKNYDLSKIYLISSFTMLILFSLTIGILTINLTDILRYPEYIILKNISLGISFQNIENIISFIWIIDIFMLLLSTTKSFIKTTSKKISNIILLLLLIIITLITNHYQTIMFVYNYSYLLLLTFTILIIIYSFKNKN